VIQKINPKYVKLVPHMTYQKYFYGTELDNWLARVSDEVGYQQPEEFKIYQKYWNKTSIMDKELAQKMFDEPVCNYVHEALEILIGMRDVAHSHMLLRRMAEVHGPSAYYIWRVLIEINPETALKIATVTADGEWPVWKP
jgi:hypothetical protein